MKDEDALRMANIPVPDDIRECAKRITKWAEDNNLNRWILFGICSRNFADPPTPQKPRATVDYWPSWYSNGDARLEVRWSLADTGEYRSEHLIRDMSETGYCTATDTFTLLSNFSRSIGQDIIAVTTHHESLKDQKHA